MEPQKEIDEGKGAAYDMERRLLALKNAYAENVDQKRDGLHAYGSGIASALSERKGGLPSVGIDPKPWRPQ